MVSSSFSHQVELGILNDFDMVTLGGKVSSYYYHQGGLGILNDSDMVNHGRKVSSYFTHQGGLSILYETVNMVTMGERIVTYLIYPIITLRYG